MSTYICSWHATEWKVSSITNCDRDWKQKGLYRYTYTWCTNPTILYIYNTHIYVYNIYTYRYVQFNHWEHCRTKAYLLVIISVHRHAKIRYGKGENNEFHGRLVLNVIFVVQSLVTNDKDSNCSFYTHMHVYMYMFMYRIAC